MQSPLLLHLCVGLAIVLSSGVAATKARPRVVRYEYFDDYLLSVADPRRHIQNEVVKYRPARGQDENATTSSPVESNTESNVENLQPIQTVNILAYFRDVPRRHWSCCMLGRLAGDKGFHCHAAFYAARITLRNPNRAHNRKLPFTGSNSAPEWGRDIMRTFQRCVRRHSESFHKCCYAAAIEQRELVRWRHFRLVNNESN